MPATASLRIGLAALRLNPLRTGLSTLGIVVGTAALVAVLALGDGVEQYARAQIERTTDLQTIVLTPRTTRVVDGQRLRRTDYPLFSAADADTARRLAGPGGGATLMLTGVLLLATDSAPRAIAMSGTDSNVLAFRELPLAVGRFLSAADAAAPAPVVVVSHRLADERRLGVGDTVQLGGRPWTVIGVLADGGSDRTLEAYAPLPVVATVLGELGGPDATVPVLLLKASRVEDVDSLRAGLESWLDRRVGADWKDRVMLGTRAARLAQVAQGMLVFKILMGAITGISLVVGGIGIMNVLLAAVAERTREIGLRKAAGARRGDILWQFLAESVAITAVGSAVGAVLGLGGAFLVTGMMRARTEAVVYAAFTWGTIAVATAAALFVGFAFGMYPALRAARLSPIDAMRHE